MSPGYHLMTKKLDQGDFFMDYRIIKKPVISKGKKVHRYYYYFYESWTGKKIQKVCKECKTQAEANAFISNQPSLYEKEKVTVAKIAEFMFVPAARINAIIKGTRAITADTALRFGKYFGTGPEFWLNLQANYDLCLAEKEAEKDLTRIQVYAFA